MLPTIFVRFERIDTRSAAADKPIAIFARSLVLSGFRKESPFSGTTSVFRFRCGFPSSVLSLFRLSRDSRYPRLMHSERTSISSRVGGVWNGFSPLETLRIIFRISFVNSFSVLIMMFRSCIFNIQYFIKGGRERQQTEQIRKGEAKGWYTTMSSACVKSEKSAFAYWKKSAALQTARLGNGICERVPLLWRRFRKLLIISASQSGIC